MVAAQFVFNSYREEFIYIILRNVSNHFILNVTRDHFLFSYTFNVGRKYIFLEATIDMFVERIDFTVN